MAPTNSWAVEVCHASDHDLDGKWYVLELCGTEDAANRALRWYGRNRKASYHGRPLRVVPSTKIIPPMPTPNPPPARWARQMRRAKRSIRA